MGALKEAEVPAVVQALRAAAAGEVIDSSDGRFEQARKVWNATVDRRPLAIVRCASAQQVAAAIDVARGSGSSWPSVVVGIRCRGSARPTEGS